MENATKALTMAAGVLIAMMVVSLIVVGINRLGSVRKVEQEALLNEELEKFNRNFESYNTNVVSGYKILSLANMAYDTNQRYKDVDGYEQVQVYVRFTNPEEKIEIDNTKGKEKEILRYSYIESLEKQPATQKGTSIGVSSDNTYYNMIGYVNNGNGQYYKIGSDKAMKKFRDKYFTCISTQYDDKSATASGRVIKMVFDEIQKVG